MHIRCLHDIGHTVWWILLGVFAVLFNLIKSGEKNVNKYGEVPLKEAKFFDMIFNHHWEKIKINKNLKRFLQTPLLRVIIAGILVLSIIGYFSVKQYQNYQTKKAENARIVQETQQQKDSEVEKLRQEVETLKNKKPQIIQQTIIKEIPSQTPSQTTEPNLSTIIAYWRPRIAYIECDFYANGAIAMTQTGSGTMLQESNGGIIIFTNNHVISFLNEYGADLCRSKFPEDNNIFTSTGTFRSKSGLDWGILRITPDEYLKNIPYRANIGCSTKPVIGDSIVILGYPGIGSKTDITATEGIISGYDGDYYITSAKVEHGNSGGAAILIKDNCFLGVPSFAQVGGVESLARILDLNVIYK